jgi:hypothetical protein
MTLAVRAPTDTAGDADPVPPLAAPVSAPFPARPVPTSWPATRQTRDQAMVELTAPQFVLKDAARRSKRFLGVTLLLDWLADHPGRSWQERWCATGSDAAGRAWRELPQDWLSRHGYGTWRQEALVEALPVVVSADLVRPSLPWLVSGAPARGGLLVRTIAAARDREAFARLQAACDADSGLSATASARVLFRAALLLAAKGGRLADIAVGDVLELLDAEARVHASPTNGGPLFYRLLHQLGIFGHQAPTTLRELRTSGQRTPEELVDRYGLACRPIRALLVDYLRERQPALDYTSVDALSYHLVKRFWADIEAHHPGIDSLHLSTEVADGWKRRLATMTTVSRNAAGDELSTTVPRINYRECLTPVRAFYLDLAHWAVEEPGRWGPWVAPCPVGAEEINRRKAKRHRKARMDARTRERLPVLPVVVRTVDRERKSAHLLLEGARRAAPGTSFTVAGTTFIRPVIDRGDPAKVWADEPVGGTRRDLSREEDHAFWAWAIVEVLRATGIFSAGCPCERDPDPGVCPGQWLIVGR